LYTIATVERDVVVHSHVHMVSDVGILLLWLNVTWLYIVMYIGERRMYTIVMVERNVVVHSHVTMGYDMCILLLWLNVTLLYIAM